MDGIFQYDQWKLSYTASNQTSFCECDHCNEGIGYGCDYLLLEDGIRVHEDCFSEYSKKVLIVSTARSPER